MSISWGWLIRVLRTAEAIRVLEAGGYEAECAPLRRSVVEHVIRLHWSTTVDSRIFVEAVLNHRKHSLGKITRAAATGTPLPEGAADVIAALQSETDPDSEKISFKDMTSLMKDIPDFEILFKIWLAETQESHATLTSSASYVDFDPDEPAANLHMEPTPRSRFDAMLPSMVLLAAESFVELAVLTEEFKESLTAIRERITLLGAPKNNRPVARG